jgi:hypothetical protein
MFSCNERATRKIVNSETLLEMAKVEKNEFSGVFTGIHIRQLAYKTYIPAFFVYF